jgi:hypothetical protein
MRQARTRPWAADGAEGGIPHAYWPLWGVRQPVHIGRHRDLAMKQGQPHKIVTPGTFSSINHHITKKTPEHA